MNSNTFSLKPGDVVEIEGVILTYEEIKENKIDSVILHNLKKE